MKEIKAWAVVNDRGDLSWDSDDSPLIKKTKSEAAELLDSAFPGERVVRVTVRVEE